MRRFLSLFTMMMFCGLLSFAQSRVVTGKVTDAKGSPVPFASVVIKGGTIGVQTDVNGDYSIRVTPGDVLQISQTSYETVEIPVGSLTNLSTSLQLKTNTIAEVVVTSAFGIKRSARSASSNAQNVNNEALNTIRQTNVNNALAGKVAGVQVRSQSSAKLGAETVIRLRGENSLGVGGGALYVVDGTIVPSANDINTDDIEDISVLQGPAAAALFGPDGANGAIVINTKKAKRGQKNLGIEINSNVQFDKAYILPDFQNSYAGGNDAVLHKFTYQPGFHPAGWAGLDGKYYHDYQEDVSWGPRMAGQEYIPWYSWYEGHERAFKTATLDPQPSNSRDFFNTGVTTLNNINFSKAGEDFNFRASYTNLDQKGLIANSFLKRHSFNFNATMNLSPKFIVGANINYLDQNSNSENDDSYSNNTSGQFNQWFHRDLDMNIMKELRGLKTPQGNIATWNHGNPGLYDPAHPELFFRNYYWFSPYAYQDNISYDRGRNRLFGDLSLTYKPHNDLSFRMTYRKNQLNTNYETRQYKALETSLAGNPLGGFNVWESVNNRSAVWQGYGFGNSVSNRQSVEFIGTYRKTIRDFSVTANAGFINNKFAFDQTTWNSVGGLTVADEFLISNSVKASPHVRDQINSASRALFGSLGLGFKNFLFLDGTYRKDYSSTEAKDFSIDTKSVGASLIFSDLFKIPTSSFLSYGKIRASIGQIVNTLDPYQNTVLYDPAAYPVQWGGNTRLISEPDRLVDPTLRGAANTEQEFGIDLRFLKNRLGLSATYWDRTNKDFPYNVSTYGGTGYSQLSTNTGEVRKNGIDLQFNVIPVRNKNIEWNLNATWGRLLDNKIISIAPGITRTLAISSGQAGTNAYLVNEVGRQWGQMVGKGILRIDGQPVLDGSGKFVLNPELVNFGSPLPDYTGGVQNTFTLFSNFTVNINIDYSYGGKFFSLSKYYGNATGLYNETTVLNDKGNSIRDEIVDGGGVHVFGVDAAGKAVDYYVGARAYFEQFPFGQGIVEPYIEDLTFVKLREFSLGYRLPVDRMGVSKYVKNATFSIVSRNPWLIYAKAKGFDPSEISTNYGEDGQLPGTRSMGVNLKIGF